MGEWRIGGSKCGTHNLLFKASAVRSLENSVIEIVNVALILILQLVEKVEEVESECCRRAFDCRREPAGTQKLKVLGNVIC